MLKRDCLWLRSDGVHNFDVGGYCIGCGIEFRDVFPLAERELIARELFAACTCDGHTECDHCKSLRATTR
jgi:hypothetical protein